MRLLHDDDGGVHEGPDGDGDPAQRHDVGREAEHPEGDEGEQHGDGDGDDGDERARRVPQEEQDDDRHREDHFRHGGLERVDGSKDQVRAVVDGDDLYARRQAGLDLADPGFHPVDDVQGVLPLAHDDDSRDDLALAVQLRDTPADVGAQDHRPDVPDPHRRARLAGRQDDVLDVPHGADVAPAPDIVLCPAELDEAAPHLTVAALQGIDDLADGDAVGLEAVGVNVDLVLLSEPPDGGHLGDTRNGLEVIPEVPVLQGAQVRETLPPGLVDQRILEDPAQARGVRAKLRPHAVRKPRQHRREVFLDAGSGPIDIRAVLEDDVNVGIAVIREPPDGLHARGANHGGDDGVGDLVLDDIRALVPAREDDHLRVAEVRDRVQGQVPHGPPASNAGQEQDGDHDEAVVDAEIDDAIDHARRLSRGATGGDVLFSFSRTGITRRVAVELLLAGHGGKVEGLSPVDALAAFPIRLSHRDVLPADGVPGERAVDSRGAKLHPALGIEQEVSRDDISLPLVEPFHDLHALAEPAARLHLSRLEVTVAAIDEDRLSHARVQDGIDGHGDRRRVGDGDLHVDEHVRLEDEARVSGLQAHLEGPRGGIEEGQRLADFPFEGLSQLRHDDLCDPCREEDVCSSFS